MYDELHISGSKNSVAKRNSHSNSLGSSSVTSNSSSELPPHQSSMIYPPQWHPPSSPQNIGFYNMIVGFVANEWTIILEKLRAKHPQTRSEILLTLLWDDIYEPIWKARCNIKHNTKKSSSLEKMSSLADKLMWHHRLLKLPVCRSQCAHFDRCFGISRFQWLMVLL